MAVTTTAAPPATRTSDAARPGTAVRLLAAALVAQPALLGVNALFHPDVDLDGASILAGAAEGPTRWYLVHLVAALGAACGVPVAMALRRLVTARGRALADVAVVAAVVGSVLLAVAFLTEASTFRLLAEGDVPHAAAVALADDYTGTPEFFAVGVGFLFAVVATLLFVAALLRSRTVPRWMPALLLLGTVATSASPPGAPVGPIGFAVVAVAGAGLAGELRRRES